MGGATDGMVAISPEKTLEEIARAIPEDCRRNVVVIGSLAVGYHYLRGQSAMLVRTKDADCLLSPRIEAVQAGVLVTERLIEDNWQFREDEKWPEPGSADTPLEELPAVRLRPPGGSEWFLELLTVPPSASHRGKNWMRLATRYGHFGLCSFGFLSLTNYKPIKTDLGIGIARPEMMALANLLEHSEISPDTMSGLFASREIKRSNKDLGRVLAIAQLATGADEDALLSWADSWLAGLQSQFPQDWTELAGGVGRGLEALLASEPDLEEARLTCELGLLAFNPPTAEMLQAAGQRLIVDAIEPLVKAVEKR